jgi:23S rRNA (cytidine1920-2'-O)/16S rRNA (cytidine1409-2'-O)-methyltransferase
VARGLVPSRAEAAALIAAGRVLVTGAVAEKPGRQVAPGEPVLVCGPPSRFVGRGGDKLDGALTAFGTTVQGRRALDAGASTGGFTDCMLQRGASEVWAVDVGFGQLATSVRSDARVRVVERYNIRNARLDELGGVAFDLVVADLSFISLRTVAAPLVSLVAPGGSVVALVKPQFEVGRAAASRGRGVVRDPALWALSMGDVARAFQVGGAGLVAATVSPLKGARGNREFFFELRPGLEVEPAQVDAMVARTVELACAEGGD